MTILGIRRLTNPATRTTGGMKSERTITATIDCSESTHAIVFSGDRRFYFSLPSSVIGDASAANYGNAAILETLFRQQLGLISVDSHATPKAQPDQA